MRYSYYEEQTILKEPSKIVLIGASTGGPGVIEQIIASLPSNYPYPVCIVQHFPAALTHSFAARLQSRTTNSVIESSEGLILRSGMVIIAHGGTHLSFRMNSEGEVTLLHKSAQEGRREDFVPSVDEMFLSAADVYSPSSIMAILLSGIGDDGAEGMVKIMSLGGETLCQDEGSSAVFGMPRQAIERGGACRILSPEQMAEAIFEFGNRA